MAYPGPDGFWESGACPETHPVRLPTLFFEAIFRTHEVGMEAGDQLVYSFNDWSGYGFHGDFLNGWKEGVIEGFLDYCTYNDGSGPTQCGIVKDQSSPKCIWEGSDDVDQYKVVSEIMNFKKSAIFNKKKLYVSTNLSKYFNKDYRLA